MGDQVTSRTALYANFLLELAQIEYEMLKYKPSELAAATMNVSLRVTRQIVNWKMGIEPHCHYAEHELRACAGDLVHVILNPNPKEHTVRKNYSRRKYGSVAR